LKLYSLDFTADYYFFFTGEREGEGRRERRGKREKETERDWILIHTIVNRNRLLLFYLIFENSLLFNLRISFYYIVIEAWKSNRGIFLSQS
jgi:hypothetical protein